MDESGILDVSDESVGAVRDVSVIGVVDDKIPVDSVQSGMIVTVDGVHVTAHDSPHTVTVTVVVWP